MEDIAARQPANVILHSKIYSFIARHNVFCMSTYNASRYWNVPMKMFQTTFIQKGCIFTFNVFRWSGRKLKGNGRKVERKKK